MKSGLRREARFDRYFEGYQKRVVIDRNGEEQVKYVYVLNYYRPRLTENGFIVRKIINAVLFLISAAAQVYAGLMPNIIMNHVRYMGFAQCLGILAMILIVVYICIHISAPYNMEIHTFKGAHEKFRIASLISAIMLLAIFITGIVTLNLFKSVSFMSFVWAFMYLIAAACLFVIWILEQKTVYDQIPPDSVF